MDVTGLGRILGTQGVSPPRLTLPTHPAGDKPAARVPHDSLVLSEAARQAQAVGSSSDLRSERLAEIRAAIANGTYETPDKLDVALDRLLAEIGAAEDLAS